MTYSNTLGKVKKFHVFFDFSPSLDVFFQGLGISELQFFDQKNANFFQL
jgi:hypothetical protein